MAPALDVPAAGARREPERHPNHGLMHALMLTATIFWATNIIAGKFALRGINADALAELRVTGAAVVYLAIFAFSRRRRSLHLVPSDWWTLGRIALFGITLNQIFFIGGLSRTSAAHTGLIVALGPVMVLALSCAMRLEALTALKIAGAVMAFTGVALLTTGGGPAGPAATPLGDLLLLAGSGVFAYYTILLKKVAGRYDALSLNTIIFTLGAALMFPYSLRQVLSVHWRGLSAQAWGAAAFMIVFGSVLAYLIYAFALTGLTATRVAAFAYLQPVIAAGLGVWLLGEVLTTRVVASGALILFGVYLTEREGRPETGGEIQA